MFNLKMKKLILLSSTVFVFSSEIQAENSEKVRLNLNASSIEIYKALTGNKVRSIQFKSKEKELLEPLNSPESESDPVLKPSERILESPVRFALNSADLTEDSQEFIYKVGEIFQFAHKTHNAKRIIISGHTDALGSELYNQFLSERRAESVKQYLIQQFGFNDDSINAKGFGEMRLAYSPYSSENRRVEFSIEY